MDFHHKDCSPHLRPVLSLLEYSFLSSALYLYPKPPGGTQNQLFIVEVLRLQF